jgi:hypothetical protein
LGDLTRMPIGSQNNWRPTLQQCVKGVEELTLGGSGSRQEMDVVNCQGACPSVAHPETRQCACAHRFKEAVRECFSREH